MAGMARELLDKVICGDAREVLAQLPDGIVQTCITSPPYWGLRDYGLEPVVWDGDPECQHEWGSELPGTSDTHWYNASKYDSEKGLQGRGGKAGQFCQRCGAWRGTLGLEPSPELYVKHLIGIFEQVKRVLRPDGTAWVNIGDSYAGSWGNHKEHHNSHPDIKRKGHPIYGKDEGWCPQATPYKFGLKPKDLCLIPFRLAIALQEAGWWLRSDIVWHKTNPMPESVTDRPTKSHEYIFMLAKSGSSTFWTHRELPGTREKPEPDYRWWDYKEQVELDKEPFNWREEKFYPSNLSKYADSAEEVVYKLGKPVKAQKRYRRYNLWRGHDYYYDADAIREPHTWADKDKRFINGPSSGKGKTEMGQYSMQACGAYHPSGRNKRTVWTMSTRPYKGAHFATFPPEIPEICIQAGSADKACPTCGAAWVRVTQTNSPSKENSTGHSLDWSNSINQKTANPQTSKSLHRHGGGVYSTSITLGFKPSCSCPGNDGSGKSIVLDPFAGSGTTCAVAISLGRSYIGIEAQEKYIPLAEKRIKEAMEEKKLEQLQLRLETDLFFEAAGD